MKKLVAFSVAVVLMTALRADYSSLYWTINEADNFSGAPFDYAKVYAVNNRTGSDTYLNYVGTGGIEAGQAEFYSDVHLPEEIGRGGGYALAGPSWAAITDEMRSGDWLFSFLLYDQDGNEVGHSLRTYTFGDIANYVADFGTTPSGGALAVGVVPEPTSGLLLLLGLASLALRRKRV